VDTGTLTRNDWTALVGGVVPQRFVSTTAPGLSPIPEQFRSTSLPRVDAMMNLDRRLRLAVDCLDYEEEE
jgi:hypothetical protein